MTPGGITVQIDLDYERMERDGRFKVDAAYEIIDEIFIDNDCTLDKIEGHERTFSRAKDDRLDLTKICLSINALEGTVWFELYVSKLMFYVVDDYGEIEEEENWLLEVNRDSIGRRQKYRAGIINLKSYITLKSTTDSNFSIREFLRNTAYYLVEADGNLIFYLGKKLEDKKNLRLIYIDLDKRQMWLICILLYLMKERLLPENIVIVFGGLQDDHEESVNSVVTILKKITKSFKYIILDYTVDCFDESCAYVFDNCFLGKNMYRNLFWCNLTYTADWKIMPRDDRQVIGNVYAKRFVDGVSVKNDSQYFKNKGIHGFTYCFPRYEGDCSYKLGFYVETLIQLSKTKI